MILGKKEFFSVNTASYAHQIHNDTRRILSMTTYLCKISLLKWINSSEIVSL